MTGRFAPGLGRSSTAELVDYEASGAFPLLESWADAIFYGALGFVGGIGPPVIRLQGTAPLRNEVFHRPPPNRGRSYGATGMTFELMKVNGKQVCYDLPEGKDGLRRAAVDGDLSDLVLVAAHTRLVRARGRPSWLNAPLEEYLMTEIECVVTVRPLWVSLNHPA